MSVGKIKAVAAKLHTFFQEENSAAVDKYLNSYDYIKDLDEFKRTDSVAKSITEAFDLLQRLDNEKIRGIIVDVHNEERIRYYRDTETIERDTRIDDLIETCFKRRLFYDKPYQEPTITQLVDDVNYFNITSDNLLDIEDKLKTRYANASGFKAYTKQH